MSVVTVNVEARYVSRLREDAADRLHGIADDLLVDARRVATGGELALEISDEAEKVGRIGALLSELDTADWVRIRCDGGYLLREIQSGLYREADDLKEIAESADLRLEDVRGIVGRLSDLAVLAAEVERQLEGGTD